MADDHDSRHRPNNPLGGGADQPGANDPLAELARLIGQSDSVSDYSRSTRTTPDPLRSERLLPPGPDASSRVASPPPPSYAASPPPPYASSPPPPAYAASPPPSYDPPPPPPSFEEEPPPATMNPPPDLSHDPLPFLGRERAAGRLHEDPGADWPGSPPPVEPEVDPFRMPHSPSRQAPEPTVAGDAYFDNRDYTEPSIGLDPSGLDSPRTDFDPPPKFLQEPERPVLAPSIYPQDSDGGPMPAPHDDEFYGDAPRKGRRKGLLTVAAVFALAVVGTAGAFGYRNYLGKSHAVAPPVIKASGEPSKVAPPPPAAAQAESSASKFSYDRFGDRGKDEQVVVREEKPVDSKEIARSAVPRAAISTAPAASTPPPPPATSAPSALGEPRKVRTVQIRPDQVEPSTTPQNVTATPPNPLATPAVPPAAPPQAAPPANAQAVMPPPAASAPAAKAQAVTPPPRANSSTRVATRAPPPANAPLSLTPGSSRPAAAAPPRAPRTASAPAASASGHFLVQVSSQRSELDAESAFKSIQAKHASVLSGRPHLVKRADLGSKGVYYRAMVGPFASRDQAVQLCSNLKAAGGSCVVQTN